MSRKGKHFKEEKYNIKKFLSNILLIVFLIGIIISIYEIIVWIDNNKKTTQMISKINDVITISEEKDLNVSEKYIIDFEKLMKINSDIIGWIKVEGTEIEYPVVQGTDNSFYLKHSLDKTYNAAGWIFADYRNQFGKQRDKNTIIYGHNRRDGSMFCSLKDVLKSDWYEENKKERKIIFITKDEKNIYEPFSAYQIEQESYYLTTKFSTNEEYNKFLQTIKLRTEVNFNVDITENDEILTLSTCANNNDYRIVLHAKKIVE